MNKSSGRFRLVILDYVINQMMNPAVQKILNDIIVFKQSNFERSRPDYVTLDKQDMVGTHYLIYDISDVFQPKLVVAIRSTYEARAKEYQLKTPFLDMLPGLPEKCQMAYADFKKLHPMVADCGALAIENNYSFHKTGLKLIHICYAMIYIHITRMGYTSILGGTNERFRSSRWLEDIGSYTRGLEFDHPVWPGTHLLIMIEKFNVPSIKSICTENEVLFRNIQEFVPNDVGYQKIHSAVDELIFNETAEEKHLKLVS
ncbi:MAG: hypothetical protein B7Y39_14975 [Bdellovibrio sp. 28-41-41]|nr:MAG: hypothetical protein B7Y39_14975 [Bdellovibrio sp. 28-41-41]